MTISSVNLSEKNSVKLCVKFSHNNQCKSTKSVSKPISSVNLIEKTLRISVSNLLTTISVNPWNPCQNQFPLWISVKKTLWNSVSNFLTIISVNPRNPCQNQFPLWISAKNLYETLCQIYSQQSMQIREIRVKTNFLCESHRKNSENLCVKFTHNNQCKSVKSVSNYLEKSV